MLSSWPPILGRDGSHSGPVTGVGWAHLRPRPTQTLSLAGGSALRWHILIQEPLWAGPGPRPTGKEAGEPVRCPQLQRWPGLRVAPGLPSSLATSLPGTLDSSAGRRRCHGLQETLGGINKMTHGKYTARSLTNAGREVLCRHISYSCMLLWSLQIYNLLAHHQRPQGRKTHRSVPENPSGRVLTLPVLNGGGVTPQACQLVGGKGPRWNLGQSESLE